MMCEDDEGLRKLEDVDWVLTLSTRMHEFLLAMTHFQLFHEQKFKIPVGTDAAGGMRVVATLFAFFFASLLVFSDYCESQVKCSRTCVAENCNSIGIRYGKYCGMGWTGCAGEKPCDDLDSCCKTHDECVEKKGLINIKCHEKFKSCIKKVRKSGKMGFSRDCTYDTVVPTMAQGMDMAISLSQFGSSNFEL